MNKLINDNDKIVKWPKKSDDKHLVLTWLAEKFSLEEKYTEKEVNSIINRYHCFNDIPLLRRELISRKFLDRKDNGSQYWKIEG